MKDRVIRSPRPSTSRSDVAGQTSTVLADGASVEARYRAELKRQDAELQRKDAEIMALTVELEAFRNPPTPPPPPAKSVDARLAAPAAIALVAKGAYFATSAIAGWLVAETRDSEGRPGDRNF